MTFERLNAESLAALQARKLPRLGLFDIFTHDPGPLTEEDEQGLVRISEEYFTHFVALDRMGRCVCCDEALSSGRDILNFLGTFTWGLAHGEGFCGKCRYPARAYHRVDKLGTLNLILQYHPDDLSFTEKEKFDVDVA